MVIQAARHLAENFTLEGARRMESLTPDTKSVMALEPFKERRRLEELLNAHKIKVEVKRGSRHTDIELIEVSRGEATEENWREFMEAYKQKLLEKYNPRYIRIKGERDLIAIIKKN